MTHESSNSPHDSTAHERVRAVFFEVCDLPPAQRDAAIDQACGGDAALRAAVQKLLRRDGPERDLLADDAIESGAAFDPMNADADADADGNGNGIATTDASGARLAPSPRGARLPAEIGGYRILRRIGAGGMGTVYEAEQRDPRRIVALKTLQRWAASTSLIRRFRHETQVLGALQHPGIAQIFEARVHDPGDGGPAVPFFVMELVRGKPVTAFIRDAQLPVAERLRLFVRICAAVAYAHQHGVIHRDLKPDNILVDEQGNPKILDFGIAKSTRPDTHDKHDQLVTTLHTDVGQLVGTLPYMSPEQVGGDTALVDSRSDVYALGVVLYEMLTDRLPYEVRDRTLPEAVRVIREESHTRLSAVDRVFRGDLETILAKALEKDADRRYQSVPQLSQDVQRFLDHEPISARPPSTFYQLSKFARRNKALVGGVVGVIAALTLGVIGTTKFALDAAAREREQRWSSYLARIDAAAAALARHDVPSARRHLDEAPPEHRGWEWGHLERNLQQWAIEIDCGAALVGGASFLHGDDRVVAALADDRVCCWDVASGRTLLSLPVDGGIWRMADAPAGSLVAIATKRGDVVVIDMDSGLEADRWSVVDDSRPALEGATDKTSGLSSPEAINDLAISPDGAMVVLGTSTAVIAWSRRDRHEHRIAWQQDVTQQPRSPNGFHNVTISADGSVVAAAERLMQNRVRIWTWELSSGIARPPHRSNDAGPAVALRPGGRELAVGSTVRDVMILDTSAVSGPRALTGHTSAVRGVAYSPDGRRLASQARDSTIRVRSADDGRTLQVMYAPDGEARSAAPPHIDDSRLSFSADGSRLVSHVPGEAARILVWDVPDEPSLVLRGHTSYVYAAAFSPDGAMLASSTFGDGTLRLWDPLSGAALAVLGRLARATELRFADQGERVQVGRLGDREWDTATGAMTKKPNVERRPRVAPEANAESGPGFEADGTSSSETRSPAPQWNAFAADPTGRLEARFLRDRAPRSPAASIVQLHALDAAGAPPGAPPDATSRAASHDLVHDSRVSSAAFSPDGALLAVGCDNGEIVIWNVARRSREATLHRHAERVYAVAFSPDGRRLASGGNDNSLRLWDTATWDQVLERHEHESYIYAIAFSPDGTQIATASGDSTLRVWDSIDKPRRLAQVRAAAAMRDELRPRVAAMLAAARDTRTGPARPGETEADDVAGALRADPSLDADHRRAALRVVLESVRRSQRVERAKPGESSESGEPDDPFQPAKSANGSAQRAAASVDSTVAVPVDDAVQAALDLAGDNRPEIQRFLDRYDYDGGRAPDADAQKRTAARWLVANMPGHGFARFALVAADGHEIPFDALEHKNLEAAQARIDELEKELGTIDFKVVEFIPDLAAVTAAQLIQNHELAFDAWRSAPWRASISFETFLERILPYRATNERLDPRWREEARARIGPALEKLRATDGPAPTLDDAGAAVIKASKPWVRFRPLFYLHPTDESWSEMCASKTGRCEDQTNMALFAGRAAGVPLAGDSTPFWADRDNNHAWVVALDASGPTGSSGSVGPSRHGPAKLAHRAAKVLRGGFGVQPGALGSVKHADEPAPPWLAGRTALDVTAEYVPVSDVAVTLDAPPGGQRFAYLCVFNGGAWRPVHWDLVDRGEAGAGTAAATFTAMGRNALYLPAWWIDGAVKPAGAPLLLRPDGSTRSLVAGDDTFTLEIATEIETPADAAIDTGNDHRRPRLVVAADAPHELFVWDIAAGAWRSLGRRTATAGQPTSFEGVPSGGLYWLRTDDGRALERPFVVDNGAVVSW